jgi:hypothetical protein
MLLIGDGAITAVQPKRHCLLWEIGPQSCRQFIDEFVEHPRLARAAGLLEVLAGFALAIRQEPHP